MTSARIVTPGQAIAMIPTMTARMPSRIKEVDVDLNMKGIPFACLKRTTSSGKSEALVMPRRRDGRRCWPTCAAYGAIAGRRHRGRRPHRGYLLVAGVAAVFQ